MLVDATPGRFLNEETAFPIEVYSERKEQPSPQLRQPNSKVIGANDDEL